MEVLKGFQYTAMIVLAVAAGMLFPELFKHWGGVDLRNKHLILVVIQLVMFGMGTHMRLADFNGIASTGKGVLVGLLCHFSIMPLMGVNPERIYLITSAMGGSLAGLAACLLVLQYDIHPAIGLSFGPITFLVCVMGGLGNLLGGFAAAFIFAQLISVGGYVYAIEWGYVMAFVFFIAMMFIRPEGILFPRR